MRLYIALPMMTPSNTKNRMLWCILPACLALLPFESCAVGRAETSRSCDRVVIDSVEGDVGIWHDKIAGIARARGRTGPIDYILIVAPERADNSNMIRRMWVWWGGRPTAGAICKAGPDIEQRPGVNCAQSVPETQLQLVVTFESEGTRDAEAQTNELVTYVAEGVLCKLD